MVTYVTILLASLLAIIAAVCNLKEKESNRLTRWGWVVVIVAIIIACGNIISYYQKTKATRNLKPSDLVFWIYVSNPGNPSAEEIERLNTKKRLSGLIGDKTIIIELEPSLSPERKRALRGSKGAQIYRFRSERIIFVGDDHITRELLETKGIIFNDIRKSMGIEYGSIFVDLFVMREHYNGEVYGNALKIDHESKVDQ